jgi:excinuclease ABC subunit C
MTADLFDFAACLALIPHEPGCYLMKDHKGKIIYIGKAKDLKNRVRNYFQPSGDPRPFVKRLPQLLSQIETIITSNEKEALILENTLIKLHKPRYNVMLKDDKHYLSLRIDPEQRWPRVEVVRRPKQDHALYFGPYDSATAIRKTLQVLNKFFMLRTCPDSILEHRTRPCLQYQIKRCLGPCVLPVNRDEYMQHVQEVVMFLEGKADELVGRLQQKMLEASDDLNFEMAAHYRDQLASIHKTLERQQVVSLEEIDRDAFGLHREGDRLLVQIMFVRSGKLEGARAFPFKDQEFPDDEILSSFIAQYYSGGALIPDEVLLPLDLPDSAALAELLSDLRRAPVTLLTPAPDQSNRRALVDTANANARHAFQANHDREESSRDLLEKLQQRLGLKNYPARIECYDISNFQGDPIVASMVVFEHGEPNKQAYRQFKMRQVASQDDFASMREVLTRRLSRVVDGDDASPDLIVIDGGKGQLASALAVLEDLGLHEIDLVSLAKSRVERSGFDDPDVSRSPERIFVPNRKNPIIPKQNSAELFLLERLRDEAHRTAIAFHKKLRDKKALRSSLEDIPGIGPATRRALLLHFGGIDPIRAAPLADLKAAKNVSPKQAEAVWRFFHPDQDPAAP